MAEFKVDSWNQVQLERLRQFFQEEAKAGDTVIFDRRMAEDNAPPQEGLDDNGCNGWVYDMANKAFIGMDADTVNALADSMTLTTAYLHDHYPERGQTQTLQEEPEEDLWADDDAGLAWPDGDEPSREQEKPEWAAIVAQFTEKSAAEPSSPAPDTEKSNKQDNESDDKGAEDWAAAKEAFFKKKTPAL